MMAAVLLAAGLTECSASRNTQNTNTTSPSAETTQDAQITGVYEINASLTSLRLPDDTQKAFDKVLNGIPETSYSLIVLLAQHVVSGMNYSILCMEQMIAMDGQPELHKMSFGRSHAPLQGGFTLFSPDSQYSVQWFPEIPVLSMQQNSHLTITFFLSSNVFSAYAHDFSTPDMCCIV